MMEVKMAECLKPEVKSHSQTLVLNLFPLWDSNLLTLRQGQLQLFVYYNKFLKKDKKYSSVCKTQILWNKGVEYRLIVTECGQQ